MNIYNKYLPTIISDYSALHLLFFDRSATLILLSPGGCNQPTREVDEYRNFENAKHYTTKLNDAHVAIGIENVLNEEILSNIDLKSEFIVIIGTAVTNIIGTDLFDISKKIENITKKPVIYFNSSAFETYSKILSEAYQKMYRFICESNENDDKMINKKINLIGFNSIIHGHERFLEELITLLENDDFRICLDGKNQINNTNNKLSTKACLTLVLSEESISLAELLKKDAQIPYEKILPVSKKGVNDLYRIIQKYCGTKFNHIHEYTNNDKFIVDNRKKLLIIGEPFLLINLKNSLSVDFEINNVTLLCLSEKNILIKNFSDDIYNQVIFSTNEKKVLELLSLADVIICDPLIKEVFTQIDEKAFVPLPFFGLSGREYADIDYDYIGMKGFEFLKKQFIKTGVIKDNEKN